MLTNTAGLIVPAYFDPIDAELQYWNRLIDAAKELGDKLIVIANPNSGPYHPDDMVVNAYKDAIKQIQTHGAKVIGYVYTQYGERDANLVQGEVNRWYNNYEYDKGDGTKGYLNGIFFDEVSSNYGGPQGYYQTRYNEVKTAHQAKYMDNSLPTVVNNFGTIPDEGFLDISNTILCIFESQDGFLDWEPSEDWINPNNASRLLVLPYNIAAYSWQKWVDVVDHADSQSIGWIYVTDDTSKNPWDRLPPYFELMVQYIKTAGEFSEFNKFPLSGNVGIGTINPQAKLEIQAPWSDWMFLSQQRDIEGGGGFRIHNPWGNSDQPQGNPSRNRLEIGYRTADGRTLWGQFVLHGPTGQVGIGVLDPQAKLHVNGDIRATGDIVLDNADCAEEFAVKDREKIEPGTVMVLDKGGLLHQSTEAYDKKVAGVVSGAGDFKPGLILDKKSEQTNRMPIALMGKVYCKVDAQYAPIEVGDLLTTSPTPGHAMKAIDSTKAFGTVIGKALMSLDAGKGLISIMVALQ